MNSEQNLKLLYHLLRDANRRTDLNGVFHVLFRGGREGIGAEEGLVARRNPESGVLEVKLKTRGKLRDKEDLFSESRAGVKGILETQEPVVRTHENEMFFKGSRSQLVCTIPVDSREKGFLILESSQADHFSKEDIDFLSEMVDQTSSVIQTRSRVESSKRELECLWDVKRRIVNTAELDVTELNDLLGKILQLALARTNTANGIILMADEQTGELVTSTRAVMGELLYGVRQKWRRRKSGRATGIAFWVVDNNKPYLCGNIENDPNYVPLFKGIKSSLAVPISFQDRCIGVVVVESPETNAFTLEEQEVLEDLSKNVSILVRRAQLFEATRENDKGGRGVMIRGLSPEWEEVERRIEKASATNAMVIIRGESGTGKELVARSIHFNSKRKDKHLIVVNSAAIPDTLLESALFGHMKGAFTGATYDRVGDFERADGGTIFLDEIGDLGLPLQAKLLRVLETGEIQKIGSNQDAKRVDVRVLAATSRNLEEMMKHGEFREDLYYRLHVVPIWIPPLRDYKKSVPGMVKAFIREAAKEHTRPLEGISAEALDVLMRHDYPGNVRELKNIIEQTVILCKGKSIQIEDLPPQLVSSLRKQNPTATSRDFKSMKKQVLERFEREYLSEVLSGTRGNISKASDISGINRVNFYKLLKRHQIDPTSFR